MVEGSQCLAEECVKKVELEAGTWCLVMSNMDEESRAAKVEFRYTCMSALNKEIILFFYILHFTFALLMLQRSKLAKNKQLSSFSSYSEHQDFIASALCLH